MVCQHGEVFLKGWKSFRNKVIGAAESTAPSFGIKNVYFDLRSVCFEANCAT
jgi:hypothetical protein